MKPIDFPGSNTVFAKDQPEYQPLPAYADSGNRGMVVTCWKMSWKQRWAVLMTGHVWVHQITFKNPLQPQFLDVNPHGVPGLK
jgi:hypothetical protein